MNPTKEELLPFADDIDGAAKHFSRSTRTIRRWLQAKGLYRPNEKFRPGKIDKKIAAEIRRLEKTGDYNQTELAEMFEISQAMAGRIINNQAHRVDLKIGGSALVVVRSLDGHTTP